MDDNPIDPEIVKVAENDSTQEEVVDMDAVIEEEASDSEIKTEVTE